MRNPIEIFYDGKKYLILDSAGSFWGEGSSVEEAYISFSNKKSEIKLLSKSSRYFNGLSLLWLTYRKNIMVTLIIFALIYAQIAVFLALPSYAYNALGAKFPERVVYISDMIADKLNKMPDDDKYKINEAVKRLQLSLAKFPAVSSCEKAADKNR
jgi:hypothetical protein